MAAKRRKRRPRGSGAAPWLGGLALAVAALLYFHPLTTYLEKRGEVAVRAAEVAALQRERASLERRLAAQRSEGTIVREARKMAYVKPGEQLFIVKGIPEWRRAEAEREGEATIAGDG